MDRFLLPLHPSIVGDGSEIRRSMAGTAWLRHHGAKTAQLRRHHRPDRLGVRHRPGTISHASVRDSGHPAVLVGGFRISVPI